MAQPVFRFAPSPNGYLHLGHAYSALLTFKWATEARGRFLLRIEDIDSGRARADFTAAILDDLDWLGLTWEEPVMHQSDRFNVYRDAAADIQARGLSFPCFCSRAEIAAAAERFDPDGAPIYPGTCKHLSRFEIEDRLARHIPVQYRIDVQKALEKTGPLTFTIAGPTPADRPQIRYARPERWGDAVIVRKETPTSYHLACVVDDAAQGVTNVTRGRDMEAATDLHVLLQFLLGLPSPVYTFHRLILDDRGEKLSKSHGAKSLRDLRAAGWSAQDVLRALGV